MLLLQVIGWSMWFSDYIFLERSWAKDETTLEVGSYACNNSYFSILTHPFPFFSNIKGFVLQSSFQSLMDFPMPFWLALFVEGTRFTQQKLLASQEYAASRGLPVPKNVLIPRTKVSWMFLFYYKSKAGINTLSLSFSLLSAYYFQGFVSAVSHMRSFVPAIYDCTVATSPKDRPPTLLRIFRGQSFVVGPQTVKNNYCLVDNPYNKHGWGVG